MDRHKIKNEKKDVLSDEILSELGDLETTFNTAKTDLTNLAKNELLPEGRYRELNMKFGHVFKIGRAHV